MNTILNDLNNLQPVDMDAGQVFSGKPSGTLVKGYAQSSAYTPAIDPSYIFHESSRDVIVWFLDPQEPLYVFGPTGCGKTSCIRQLAARLNYPVFEVTGHGRLEFADLVGHLTVKDGNMSFEYGPLALAMRYGGLMLLNEIDLTSPEVAAGLNGVLDGSPLCIAENGGELITPHPMFRFAATANTNGGGDETGLYQGAQRQNLAFADRFILCEVGYPEPAVEEKLLHQRFPGLPKKLCKTMVDYANEVRKLFMGESSSSSLTNSIEVTFSTRSLLRWGDLTVRFQPLARQGIQPVTYALDRALAYRASRESRAMLHELVQRMFPEHGKEPGPETGTPGDESLTGTDGIRFLTAKLANLPATANPSVYLRKTYRTPDGGSASKDWMGQARSEGMTLQFGRTGSKGQQRFYEAKDCWRNDPFHELALRAAQKLREGYHIIPEKSSL